MLSILTGDLSAQDARSAYGEHAEVRLVEVAVRVLRAGEAVRGLTASDFTVLDRGQPVPIVGFEVLERGRGEGPEDLTARERPRRPLLLLFDFAYSSGSGLARSVAASREVVQERLEEGGEVGVGFFSALRGMRLVAPLVTDPGAAHAGLDCIEALLARDAEGAERSLRRALVGPGSTVGAPVATASEVRAEAGIMVRADPYWPHRSLIRSQARGLRHLVTTAPVDLGPVQIIWFSHGFDSSFLTGRGGSSSLAELEAAFRELRRQGWVVDAVNVDGVKVGIGRESLFYLANETGGEAYENFNRPSEALRLMSRRRAVTYLLILDTSRSKPDGRFHRLSVRLRDQPPGTRIVHRPGYYAPGSDLDTPFPGS